MVTKIYVLCVISVQILISVQSNPIIIRSGIVKNQGQQQNANIFDLAHHKGIANYEGEEGFNKDNERKFVKAADSGRYGEEAGKKKDHVDQNNFADEKFFQQGGGEVSDFGNKVAHKKGHHKSGFHNSYHKDETGSNSSYYDDGDDEGDEYVYKTKKGSYGDLGQQRNRGSHLDSSHYLQDQAKRGQYDNAGNFQKDHGNQQNYNRKNYYNNREDEARRNAGNRYGEDGRFAEEKYVQRPHYVPNSPVYYGDEYYDRPRNPIHQKQHITIYEDPRVYDQGLDYHGYERDVPHYGNDYVELEVKRPPYVDDYNRYHDRRSVAYYDY